MNWWRRLRTWIRIGLLEGRLQRHGYRRLHEVQVDESGRRTKKVVYDLSDAVIKLQTVAEDVEHLLEELGGEDDR